MNKCLSLVPLITVCLLPLGAGFEVIFIGRFCLIAEVREK